MLRNFPDTLSNCASIPGSCMKNCGTWPSCSALTNFPLHLRTNNVGCFCCPDTLRLVNGWLLSVILMSYSRCLFRDWSTSHERNKGVWLQHKHIQRNGSSSHLALMQLTCKLNSSIVRFCQNWTFSNQIFWRQTIILFASFLFPLNWR